MSDECCLSIDGEFGRGGLDRIFQVESRDRRLDFSRAGYQPAPDESYED
jgi:hypothetical protein